MKCRDCPRYDKELIACECSPYEIEDMTCLLKNILCVLLNDVEDDGEDWKYST